MFKSEIRGAFSSGLGVQDGVGGIYHTEIPVPHLQSAWGHSFGGTTSSTFIVGSRAVQWGALAIVQDKVAILQSINTL